MLRSGRGLATVSLAGLARMLCVSEATIRVYLNNPLFFRGWYRVAPDTYKVYLVGLKKIQAQASIGTKFESLHTKLTDVLLEARLARTLYLQRAARRAAVKTHKATQAPKSSKRRKRGSIKGQQPLTHGSFFDENGNPLTINHGANHISVKGSTTTVFLSKDAIYSGVTQKTIAKVFGRSVATIRKALRNTAKVRLYQFKPEFHLKRLEAQFTEAESFGSYGNAEDSKPSKYYYRYGNYTYAPLPTAYYGAIDLLGHYK